MSDKAAEWEQKKTFEKTKEDAPSASGRFMSKVHGGLESRQMNGTEHLYGPANQQGTLWQASTGQLVCNFRRCRGSVKVM